VSPKENWPPPNQQCLNKESPAEHLASRDLQALQSSVDTSWNRSFPKFRWNRATEEFDDALLACVCPAGSFPSTRAHWRFLTASYPCPGIVQALNWREVSTGQSTAKYYAIKSIEEAKAYLSHPVLGLRLLECAGAVVRIEGRSATDIFGSPDDLKLRSSATLFACVFPGSVFDRLLDKYYRGERDKKTLQLLSLDPGI
jgi:uncharacterized protein (DUF1810 family)